MVDFEKTFDDFCNVSNTNVNYIKDLKTMFSNVTAKQLEVIHQLKFYAIKWDCPELLEFCNTYMEDIKNKGIKQGLFGANLKSIVKAYSLDEMWGKINANNVNKVE